MQSPMILVALSFIIQFASIICYWGKPVSVSAFTLFSISKSTSGLILVQPRFRQVHHHHHHHISPSTSILHSSNQEEKEDDPSSSSVVLPPIPEEWKGQVLNSLSHIIDPDFNKDIVSLGFIQNLILDTDTRQVSFDVQLTTVACPIKESFRQDCIQAINALPWTNGKVQVHMTALPDIAIQQDTNIPLGLSRVKAIIAVSSCKGGVGKSTTAVNLAFTLSQLGASVGIFDADLYGPSLPTMVKPDQDIIQFVGRQIAPLSRNGVKLMSFGYVNQGSAVMRGPMVSQLLDQLISITYWGPLDYLVLDMPPGTGDIQLTLCQKLNITAAVIVTTPQELSFVDVERGIEMFDTVQVPCIAVVENMAYLDMTRERTITTTATLTSSNTTTTMTPSLDYRSLKEEFQQILIQEKVLEKQSPSMDSVLSQLIQRVQLATVHLPSPIIKENVLENNPLGAFRIFGPGHKHRLSNQWGIDHTFSVPLLSTIAQNGDSGTPFILQHPSSPESMIFKDLASAVVREISKMKYASGHRTRPNIAFEEDKHLLQVILPTDNTKMNIVSGSIPPADLRRQCKCASCVEELSGRQILQPWSIPDSVKPRKMSSTGNYAWSIDWSDGHKSLYPYRQIRSILELRSKPHPDSTDVEKPNEQNQRKLNDIMIVK